MKKFLILFLLVYVTSQVSAQKASQIVGLWWNEKKTSKIEVKEVNGTYTATVVYILPEKYVNGEPERDTENPDPALRSRSKLGLQIMSGLKFDAAEKEWSNGRIYDPDSGKTYDCYAWFEDNNFDILNLKGFVVGIRWLGKSTQWTKVTQ